MALKILSIGNSFSADSLQWLPHILKELGENDATVAYLFIGGCSLQRHYDNVLEPTEDYVYYKNCGDGWTETPNATLLQGIKDEPWDIILFQQASHFSGKPLSYAPLKPLIDFVDKEKTNPEVKYGFNMTWAYQGNSTHKAFPNYGSDQLTMYRAICATVKLIICAEPMIYKIFPTGTVIQNLRLGSLGDRLTRDGFHLSFGAGRFAAALGIAYQLGYPINDLNTAPTETSISPELLSEMKCAVKNAALIPFEIIGI